jgi:hypothetical protein
MLNEEQIQQVLEKNRAIIKSFGVRKLDLLKPGANESLALDFQVEFKDMSLDIYKSFKGYLEEIVGEDVGLTLKTPARSTAR